LRVVLCTGFLGSGKTTLILALVRQATDLGQRICVIVNEIGDVGIDGTVLRTGNLEVHEITAGCICCQIGVDLVRTLREVAERLEPDLVIIEASGVATPAGVLQVLDRYFVADRDVTVETVTVVDPTRFAALHEVLTPLIEDQIKGADQLVIAKVDEAAPDEIEVALQAMRSLAPSAAIHLVESSRPETLAPLLAALTPLQTVLARPPAALAPLPIALAGRNDRPRDAVTPMESLAPHGSSIRVVAGEKGLNPEAFLIALLERIAFDCEQPPLPSSGT